MPKYYPPLESIAWRPLPIHGEELRQLVNRHASVRYRGRYWRYRRQEGVLIRRNAPLVQVRFPDSGSAFGRFAWITPRNLEYRP